MKKLIALFLLVAFSANAQTADKIIFKISNVVPVKNTDNVTTSCDYDLTIFNRTNKEINNISFDLNWEDEVVLDTIANEVKESKKKTSIFAKGSSRTKQFTSSGIKSAPMINKIPAKKQIVSKQKVNTSRCFLLLENPEISAKSCLQTNGQEKINCADAIEFIDTNNPEYYTDFSDESFDEKEDRQMMETQKSIEEINAIHNKNKKVVDEIKSTLKTME